MKQGLKFSIGGLIPEQYLVAIVLLANALLGLMVAKYGLFFLGEVTYSNSMRAIFTIEMLSLLCSLGAPLYIEKSSAEKSNLDNLFKLSILILVFVLVCVFIVTYFEIIQLSIIESTALSVAVFLTIYARAATRSLIAAKGGVHSSLFQILETKLPILIALIVSYYAGLLLIITSYLIFKLFACMALLNTHVRYRKSSKFDVNLWGFDLVTLLTGNVIMIYFYMFGEIQFAEAWIGFLIANSVATIIFNSSRISFFTHVWGKGEYIYKKYYEIFTLLFFILVMSLYGKELIYFVFGLDSIETVGVTVGTAVSWVLYSLVGPNFEKVIVHEQISVFSVLGSTLLVILTVFCFIYFEYAPLYSLYALPVIVQLISRYYVKNHIERR